MYYVVMQAQVNQRYITYIMTRTVDVLHGDASHGQTTLYHIHNTLNVLHGDAGISQITSNHLHVSLMKMLTFPNIYLLELSKYCGKNNPKEQQR